MTISWCRTRPTVCGRNGAVAAAHPLAAQAGFDMLRAGGNAVDAAVATAAALAVVEPYMSGPGGVGFLLLTEPGSGSRVLNYSGAAPGLATPETVDEDDTELGPKACLIPGSVAGWFRALADVGRLSPAEVFAPAIRLANDGFPLHPFNARAIHDNRPRLNHVGESIFGSLNCRIGEVLHQPDLATTYQTLVEQGPDAFYRGAIADQISGFIEESGGLLRADDLAWYEPEWQTPIAAPYSDCEVRTCPPNNEGFQILETLRLLDSFDLAAMGHNSVEYIHVVSEAMKLAVADRIRWAGDPVFQPVPVDQLLSDTYINDRRSLVNLERASVSEGERWREPRSSLAVGPGKVEGLTTHFAAVDSDGCVASITQSLGNGFGSGVYVPETGVALNNFMWWMDVDADCATPNVVAPRKRWSCCMAPVHVFRDNQFWFSVATPGSWGILQTIPQMLLNVVEFGADPQLAIEAPRFRLWEETRMQIEDRVDSQVRADLETRGHKLELIGDFSFYVGGGQIVMVDPESNARMAGADPRRDGYALAY